ncbi:DUF1043 family protein [Alginatibacterium sediminis]|uniref:Z-ring associated protein G n=1 Tax=Alginatibacterium sediminis TaxID=2164068 RepID=A0A420E943_9ALTE|nr:YhcB family protein [Alginatibacterium sediminis]RKF15907.1 DUF1043 family protein [Alginatibacterium sediminis]
MDAVNSLALVLLGMVIGYIVARLFNKSSTLDAQSKVDYENNRRELEQYRTQVNSHFETSAQLLEDMAKHYQNIYEHMASQSRELMKEEQQPTLFAEFEQNKEEEPKVENLESQPKDYSNQPSGLFKAQRKAS